MKVLINNKTYNYLQTRYFCEKIIVIIFSPFIILFAGLLSIPLLFFFGKNLLYIQKRPGLNSEPFKLYKFRTIDEYGKIRPFLQFLRNHRIDEVPQFINILKGDMSLIGPRPEPLEYYNEIISAIPEYKDRYCIKPGITGLAQVKFKHTLNIDDSRKKLFFDLEYIKNISIWNDFGILLRTIMVVINKSGAR